VITGGLIEALRSFSVCARDRATRVSRLPCADDVARPARFSAPRNQGNRASSRATASAAVGPGVAHRATFGGGTGVRARRARRARWLRPWARPPRTESPQLQRRFVEKRIGIDGHGVLSGHHTEYLLSEDTSNSQFALWFTFDDDSPIRRGACFWLSSFVRAS
jgi:hypothetical protein